MSAMTFAKRRATARPKRNRLKTLNGAIKAALASNCDTLGCCRFMPVEIRKI